MSDREFAKLQMRRNSPTTSNTEKTKLTRQINTELERRKTVSANSLPQVGSSKAQNPARWRRGADIKVGDEAAVRWEGKNPVEFSRVVSVSRVDASEVGQSGGRQYRVTLADGKTRTTTAAGFIEGRYAGAAKMDGATVRVRRPKK